jgi:hypothetical protein
MQRARVTSGGGHIRRVHVSVRRYLRRGLHRHRSMRNAHLQPHGQLERQERQQNAG